MAHLYGFFKIILRLYVTYAKRKIYPSSIETVAEGGKKQEIPLPGGIGPSKEKENWRQPIGVGYVTSNTVYAAETRGPGIGSFTYGISDKTGLPYLGIRNGASFNRGMSSFSANHEFRLEINVQRIQAAAILVTGAYVIWQTGGFAAPIVIPALAR